MENIKVSVIVNFYNSEKYVDKCLSALMNQTLKELEFIVVDDGSMDHTAEIVEAYARKDDRIKKIIKKNGGLASARKTGMKSARGEYITFIDGDDYVKPGMYEHMYSLAQKDGLDIVQCNFEPLGDYDKWKVVENLKIYTEEIISGEELLNMYLKRDVMPALWQRIFRNGLWSAEDFKVRSKVMSDHFNFPEWAIRAKKVRIIHDDYYVWLTRKGSLGQPSGDEENANAKNRFLSGISILDFSKIDDARWQDNVVFYLTSYITQTAYHLSKGNEKGVALVYDLWNQLKGDRFVSNLALLAVPDYVKTFFNYLENNRGKMQRFVSGDFFVSARKFIEQNSYNGSDLFDGLYS